MHGYPTMADREAGDGSGGTDARLRGIGCAGHRMAASMRARGAQHGDPLPKRVATSSKALLQSKATDWTVCQRRSLNLRVSFIFAPTAIV
jgi:hypothetical protein